MIMPGRSDGICFSIFRSMSTMAAEQHEPLVAHMANGEADLGDGFAFTKDANLKVLARAVGKLGAAWC
jgi:hypothetical protein